MHPQHNKRPQATPEPDFQIQSYGGGAPEPRRYATQGKCIVKTTKYFQSLKARPDRAGIKDEWIMYVVEHPEREHTQADGRIRRWSRIEEAGGRCLRVILLPDKETIHNAFFDRGYKP